MRITLEREILRSEILRNHILMVLFFILAIYVNIFAYAYKAQFNIIFANTPHWVPSLFLISISFYYGIVCRIFKICEKRHSSFPTWGRFLTAFIETSIPTLFIYLIAQFHQPVYALMSARITLYFIFIILSALSLDLRLCVFTGLVAALEYSGISFYFLHHTNVPDLDPYLLVPEHFITRSFIMFICGCATAFVTSQIKHQLMAVFGAERERDKIANIFGRHVSPEVVNMLLSQKTKEGGEARFVCVLFLDIRNFTEYAEDKKPEEVVSYLNQLFGSMINIVNNNHGIINKFLGDGLMAVFGAPVSGHHDTDNAVLAAEQIVTQIQKDVALGLIPETKVGIGIHCGVVVTGNVGAPQRQEYTIIGDVVNLTSRIEQLNKVYESEILISEEVYNGLKNKRGDLLGEITIRGRHHPIRIYRLK